jgi:putative ABC transport system substrate-binding protein
MKRRNLITGLGGAALMAPVAARAQQKPMRVIGILSPHPAITAATEPFWKPYLAAMHRALGECGYVEGQNLRLEWRCAEGHYDRLPTLAAELVSLKVDVIEAISNIGARAAKNATSTIPIVFNAIDRPVETGIVASLARPGGNITGATDFSGQLAPKFLDLLSELLPHAKTIGLLVNPGIPSAAEYFIRNVGEAVSARGMNLAVQAAITEGEIDAAFVLFAEAKPDALIVSADAFFLSRAPQLVALSSHHGIPTIYYNVVYPRGGGLICYGVDEVEVFGRAFAQVGKILNGANPLKCRSSGRPNSSLPSISRRRRRLD